MLKKINKILNYKYKITIEVSEILLNQYGEKEISRDHFQKVIAFHYKKEIRSKTPEKRKS